MEVSELAFLFSCLCHKFPIRKKVCILTLHQLKTTGPDINEALLLADLIPP